MNRNRPIVCAAALAGSALLWTCDKDGTVFGPQDLRAYPGSIAGRVQDQKGNAVPGALVTVYPGGATTVSGDSGKFEIGDVAPGAYRIFLAKADYRDTSRPDSLRVGLGEGRKVDSLRLAYRFATVKGTVDTAGTGSQFPGVVVEDQDVSTTVSPSGRFTLGRIEPGHVRLFAACQGLGYGMRELDLRAGDTVTSTLSIDHRGGTVVGQVVDASGASVVGASVSTVNGALRTTSDDSGKFVLQGVPATAVVRVARGSWGTTVTGVAVPEGGKHDLSTVAIGTQRASGRLPVPQDGIALGVVTDDTIWLVARDSVGTDTSWHARRWLWSSGSSWRDSTSTNILPLVRTDVGWTTAGTRTVQVRERLYRVSGGVVSDSVTGSATITVRLAPPPDRTPPTLRKVSPSKDTAVANGTMLLAATWAVSDDRKMDSAWIDGKPARLDSGKVSKLDTLAVGRNVIHLFARDSAGNPSWDSLVVTRASAPAHRDARLDSLRVAPGTISPIFHRDTTRYRDTVESADSFVVVRAKAADSQAVVLVGGNPSRGAADTVKLAAAGSSTTIPIRVAAGTDSATYELTVWRKARVGAVDTMGLSGLVAYYPFDGDAKDASGNGNDGVVTETSSDVDRFGRSTGAFLFDAKASRVSVAKRGGLAFNGPLSIASWLRHAPSRNQESIVNSWYDGTEPDRGVVLEFKEDSIRFNLASDRTGPSAPESRLADNRWHFVVAAWDGAEMSLWIDDSLASRVSHSGDLTDQAESLGIGYDPDISGHIGSFFGGNLDDIRIYNRALTAAEIGKLYHEGGWVGTAPDTLTTLHALEVDTSSGRLAPRFDSSIAAYTDTIRAGVTNFVLTATASSSSDTIRVNGKIFKSGVKDSVALGADTVVRVVVTSPNTSATRTYTVNILHRAVSSDALGIAGLVAYYPFEGDAKDGSGNGNDGVVNGAALSPDRFGKASSAYDFNGTNSSIRVDYAKVPPVTDAITVSLWMDMRDSISNQKLISNLLSSHEGFLLGIGDGVLYPEVVQSSNGFAVHKGVVRTNRWMHYVFAYKQGSVFRSYLDGKIVADTVPSSLPVTMNSGIGIGSHLWAGGEYFANGRIDDIRIYNRILDSAEIGKLYHEGGWTGAVAPQDTASLTVIVPRNNSDTLWPLDTIRAASASKLEYAIDAGAWTAFPTSGLVLAQACSLSVRATDTGKVARVWGKKFAFTTWNPKVTYEFLQDSRDGKSYRTVKIGTQTWMAENLNYVGSGTDTGACYNNSADSCSKYGRLYTWSEAMAVSSSYNTTTWGGSDVKGICPSDWHVPSDDDWTTLASTVEEISGAGSGNGGATLKSTSGWSGSSSGTDVYGFRGLPAGVRYDDRSFGRADLYGYWWSTTEIDAGRAWSHVLISGNAGVVRSDDVKATGFSLRCLKNSSDTLTTLHGLSLDSGALTRTFDSTVASYTDSVASTVRGLKITATASSSGAIVKINGTTTASGAATSVDVSTDTTITIVVSSPNTPTTHIYTVRVAHKVAVRAVGLSGTVTDVTGAPMSGVGVALAGTSLTTETATDGSWALSGTVPASSGGPDTLVYSYGGTAFRRDALASLAQTGIARTYVAPASTDTSTALASLAAGTLSPSFNPDWLNYTRRRSAASYTLSFATSSTVAAVKVNGTPMVLSSGSGSITIPAADTIARIEVSNPNTSNVRTYTIRVVDTVAAPEFDLAAGSYAYGQALTMSCATGGASIHYTTDGGAPTTSSTKYTGAITLGATGTVRAIAVKNGVSSAENGAAYTITAKALAIGGTFTAGDKVYDGSTSAAIDANSLALSGVVGADVVTLSPVLAFSDAAVGAGKTVSLVGGTLGGADASKYSLSLASAPTATASITAKALTVGGTFTADDKVYDGTTSATIHAGGLTLGGVVGADAVTLVPAAVFSDAATGAGKTVSLAGSTIAGAGASNYTLSLAGAPTTTASITAPTSGTFTDGRNSQSYKWVAIGSQVWMAQNLNYSGTVSTVGACYDNSTDSCTSTGRLYTWSEVMSGLASSDASPSGVQGICPAGWHVPSDPEWFRLDTALGSATAGKLLKSAMGWYNSGNGTDSYGFDALPGGERDSASRFTGNGKYANFWSSTEKSASRAWFQQLGYAYDYSNRLDYDKSRMFSLRCIRD